MSALEALVLAGKGLNAFSVLFQVNFRVCHYKTALSRLQVYRPEISRVQITRLPRRPAWPDNSAVALHAYSLFYMGAAQLQ
jgi:hypothetical protein